MTFLKSIEGIVHIYIEPHFLLFICAFMLIFLIIHLSRKLDNVFVVFFGLLVVVALFGFVAIYYENSVPFEVVLAFLIAYSVSIYIVLCEVLRLGLAQWFTQKRGEKWVKELDYIYLMLGFVGVIGSLNKIDVITGRYSKYEIVAPVVLATAIVIRFIKTRAEIGGWNKLKSRPINGC